MDKVASPQYATPTLRRARLIDWLDDASTCRAAVIAADAGYGKTTLLWQWEREAPFPCYWYKLDRNDRDWTFYISYLIEAISKRHEGFGRRAHSILQQMGGPGSSRPGVAAYLLAEMHERLTEPCTFTIDDWRYVNAVTEVRGLWNQILRCPGHLPLHLRLAREAAPAVRSFRGARWLSPCALSVGKFKPRRAGLARGARRVRSD